MRLRRPWCWFVWLSNVGVALLDGDDVDAVQTWLNMGDAGIGFAGITATSKCIALLLQVLQEVAYCNLLLRPST